MQEIYEIFNKFFTIEQVKQTLIANVNDRNKTLADLKFKESKYKIFFHQFRLIKVEK